MEVLDIADLYGMSTHRRRIGRLKPPLMNLASNAIGHRIIGILTSIHDAEKTVLRPDQTHFLTTAIASISYKSCGVARAATRITVLGGA